ncbi:MAG: radical SAM family heme chaperone HemW [Lachnospiraceae bacterium]|nr:radical SAM family heme chaperone HemW [Lachnospiraceae bacterium]
MGDGFGTPPSGGPELSPIPTPIRGPEPSPIPTPVCGSKNPLIDTYLQDLRNEITFRAPHAAGYEVVSVFFGGGTPSLLPAQELAGILTCLREQYAFAPDAEVSLECNPGTADFGKLKALRDAGFNRISFGVQSLRDAELRTLGRIHTAQQALSCYADAVRAGFTNINLDLMSGLPGQRAADFEETLRQVLSLNPAPTHLSAYSLIVEEGTPLAERIARGVLPEPDEDADRACYHLTARLLREAGYERYEISNYALPGYECRHNIGYWTGREYLGLGLGAASYFGGARFSDPEDPESYHRAQETHLPDAPWDPRQECGYEPLSADERMKEYALLGLRMTEGIGEGTFRERFGRELSEVFGEILQRHLRNGLLCIYEKNGEHFYALTEKGLDLANVVMRDFV